MAANPNPGGSVYTRGDCAEGDINTQWNAVIAQVNDERENPPGDTNCDPLDPIDCVGADHVWTKNDIQIVHNAIDDMCPFSWSEIPDYWKQEIIDEIDEALSRDNGGWGDTDECCEETGPILTEFGPFEYDGTLLEASTCSGTCCGDTECTSPCYICGAECCAWAQHMGTYYPPNATVIISYSNTAFYSFGGLGIGGWQAMLDWHSATDNALDAAKAMDTYQAALDILVVQVDAAIAAYQACLVANPGNPSACASLKTAICTYGTQASAKQAQVDGQYAILNVEYPKITPAADSFNSYAAINWAAQKACPGGRYPPDINVIAEMGGNYEGYDWGKWFRPKFDDSLYDCRPQAYFNGAQTVFISPNGTPMKQGIVIRVVTVIYQRIIVWHSCDQWAGNYCEWDCTGERIGACETFSECTLLHVTGGCGFAPQETQELWDFLDGEAAAIHYEFDGYVLDPLGRQGKDYTDEQTEFWNEHLNWYDEHPQYDDRHTPYC